MKNEPVRLAGIAAALVGLAARFGLPIPEEFRELATTLLVVVLPILSNEIARRFSTGPETLKRLIAEATKAGQS